MDRIAPDPEQRRWSELLEHWHGRRLTEAEAPELMRAAVLRSDYALAIDVRDAWVDRADARVARLLAAHGAWVELRLGRVEAAREHLDRIDLADVAADPGLAAIVARVRLSLAAADRRSDEMDRQLAAGLAAAERAGDLDLLLRLRATAASTRADLGELGPAVDALDVTVVDAEASGSALLLADVLYARGDVFFGAGRLEEAICDYQAVIVARQRAGVPATLALAAVGDCRIESGDLRRARLDLEAAVASARRTGDRSHLVACLAALARARCLDDPAAAANLVDEAIGLGPTPGYPRAVALAISAWIAWLQGDPIMARERATAAEDEASAQRTPLIGPDMALVHAALTPDPARRQAFAEEALRGWEAVGNPIWTARARLAATIVTRAGASDALLAADEHLRGLGDAEVIAGLGGGLLVSAWRRARGIRIQVLGRFSVTIEGSVVGATAWRSRKAQDLLKLLVIAREPVTKDRLGEQLWPDDEADAVANRLSVALATLRAGLDPDRHHPPDHAIGSDGRSLWLDRAHVETDLDRFLALAAHAEDPGLAGDALARRAALRAAEAAYAGELLPEDAYADWAVEPRERVQARALALDRALAELALAAGDTSEAIRYRLRFLERDPYDEPAHLGLVTALGRAGRHGEARRAYAAYVARLRELDVEAAPFPTLGRT